MCKYAPSDRARGVQASSAPLARVELSTTTCSRLGLVPSARDLWEESGMTFSTDRRPPGVPLRARALPAQPSPWGEASEGGRRPPSHGSQWVSLFHDQ